MPRRIVLSFAPSAAAGGQGDRMSTAWSATQHDRASFLALGRAVCSISFGTVPPIFTPKLLKKQDGMLAFFHTSGRCRTNVLLGDSLGYVSGISSFHSASPCVASTSVLRLRFSHLKQDEMPAFFQASARRRPNVLRSILVSFSLPGVLCLRFSQPKCV